MSNSIHFSHHSGIHTLQVEQFVPIQLDKAWEFFSNPENLSTITPAAMNFTITSGTPAKMFAGQIITYKVNALPFVKSNWVTEITQVKDFSYFIDEQRFGPYRMWHHEHHFEQKGNGVLMYDKVTYKIPFGIFGEIAHTLFIKSKLTQIFTFRVKILKELLGE